MIPRSLLAVSLVATTLATGSRAFADPTSIDRAAARSLFDEGRRLAHQGKYAEACPKFEESQRLDGGIGTLFNLADCYEHVGRFASAWSDYLEVADAAKRAGDAEREKVARGRAQKVEGKLARLTFVRTPGGGAVEIKLDDRVLGEGALGAGLPVDRGPHTVQASAPGKKPWSTTVEAADGATATVTVPLLEDEVVAPPAPPPLAVPPPAPLPPAPEEAARPWQRPVGLVAAGVGVVGLGVGAFFGLRARSQWSDAQPHCPSTGCDAQGYASWNDSRSSATASTIAFVAGGVAAAAGVVLFLTAPSAPAAPRVGIALDRVTVDLEFR